MSLTMEKSPTKLSITTPQPMKTSTFNISNVQGAYPNKAARKLLAEEWAQLNDDEKIDLRARRSKRGWRCDICGLNGYCREICPNQCVSPPSTPDSLASSAPSTPSSMGSSKDSMTASKGPKPVGKFWGQKTFKGFREKKKKDPNEPITTAHLKQKVDLTTLRPDAMDTLDHLRGSDENLKHSFYLHSEPMYSRNFAELTLQQVMRRMIRLLEKQLKENIAESTATFDTTLLHPPKKILKSTFYPKELMKFPEFRDYFIMKESQVKDTNFSYKNQTSLRPVDDLDSLFRGPLKKLDELYVVKPNAGESVHSKNSWKSILTNNDLLANSDSSLAKKQEKLNEMFAEQSKWISMQQTAMSFQNERFEHLLYIVEKEIEKEHKREEDLFTAKTRRLEKDVALRLWQERCHSVDLFLAILQSYQFTAGLEEADYLLFCFENWQKQHKKPKIGGQSKGNTIVVEDNNGKEEETKEKEEGSGKQKKKKNADDDSDEDADSEGETTQQVAVKTLDTSQSQANKAKTKKKANRGNKNSLISAVTNPYYHDVQFIKQIERKHEKLLLKGKTASALTAAEQRELLKQKQAEQLNLLQTMEASMVNGKSTNTLTTEAGAGQGEGNTSPNGHGGMQLSPNSGGKKGVSINERMNASYDSYDTTNLTKDTTASPSPTKPQDLSIPALPSLSEIIEQAKQHQEDVKVQKQKTWHQRALLNSLESEMDGGSDGKGMKLHRKPFIHPRELDAMHIAKVTKSFKMAGLGNRIRKGNDDDFAMALPALIPIPKAFDGNSTMISHTANNIVFQLKKDMILSDLGNRVVLFLY
jgi:hypothetical protein